MGNIADPDDGCPPEDIHTDILGTWHLHGSQWIPELTRRQLPDQTDTCEGL